MNIYKERPDLLQVAYETSQPIYLKMDRSTTILFPEYGKIVVEICKAGESSSIWKDVSPYTARAMISIARRIGGKIQLNEEGFLIG